MKKVINVIFGFIFIIYTSTILADQPRGSLLLNGVDNNVGVILCHGRDSFPDTPVIKSLRTEINKQLGYSTLSLDMPSLGRSIDDINDFSKKVYKSEKVIEQGIKFLQQDIGVKKIYLIGHSMGARMGAHFIVSRAEKNITTNVDGFIALGIRNNGEPPLNAALYLGSLNIPILDLYGGDDEFDVKNATTRADNAEFADDYILKMVKNADHKFSGEAQTNVLIQEVVEWLKSKN